MVSCADIGRGGIDLVFRTSSRARGFEAALGGRRFGEPVEAPDEKVRE